MKGWPDYVRTTGLVENYDEYAQNYPVGVGDGAARLGSIKTYDMRGRVWWMDDFEATVLHWQTAGVGVGGSQGIITDYVRNGNQALGLTSNTGAGRQSYAWKYVQLPRSQNIGIEISFSEAANFGTLYFIYQLDDGTNYTYAQIRLIEGPPAIIEYQDAGGWVDSGLYVHLSHNLTLFHTLKIVFNYDTDTWIRILYDNQETDISDILMLTLLGGVTPSISLHLSTQGDGINNTRICLDNLILTIMEPD